MASIKRFRVGDSLLRPRDNARRVLANKLLDRPPRMYVKNGSFPWKKVGGKAAVMDRFDDWGGKTFRVGLRKGGKIRTIARVDRETVKLLELNNCSRGTELVWSLVKHAFPDVVYGGGYVYKMSSPTKWSDHAWGTAVDASAYAKNDQVTEWTSDMARENCLDFDYALGSRNGQVVQVGPNGEISASGASSSHKWHVHYSVVDHDGRKPPRTGGVW